MTRGRAALLRLFGPSRKEIAQKLGISDAVLSFVVNGHRQPSDDVKRRIEEHLGIPAAEWNREATS